MGFSGNGAEIEKNSSSCNGCSSDNFDDQRRFTGFPQSIKRKREMP